VREQTLESSLSNLEPADHVHPDLFAAKTVAQQFLRDFQRHGIHLPSQERNKLVELSDEILVVGRMFFAGTTAVCSYTPTWITREEAKQLGPSSSQLVSSQLHFDMHGCAALDPSDWVAHTILQQHPVEDVRRRIWQSQRESPDEQIERLETLLKLRHRFAKLTGKQTWAEVVLEDKMVGNPENVLAFLDGLAQDTRPLALQELEALRRQIHSNNNNNNNNTIQPWDRDYYSHLAAAHRTSRSCSSNSNLSAYFSVGSCLQGLSELFTAIYGVSFEVETPEGPDELWHESVVKLGVMDEQEGRLGTIYCDLFAREGKTPGAAHYTVRCSRRTDLDEDQRDMQFADSLPRERPLIDQIYPDHLQAQPLQVPLVNNIPGKIGSYQRPVVVFSCSFEPPDLTSRQPSLLPWSDVETLFHEMGHAIHCQSTFFVYPRLSVDPHSGETIS
jgi:intermediate peptidase